MLTNKDDFGMYTKQNIAVELNLNTANTNKHVSPCDIIWYEILVTYTIFRYNTMKLIHIYNVYFFVNLTCPG